MLNVGRIRHGRASSRVRRETDSRGRRLCKATETKRANSAYSPGGNHRRHGHIIGHVYLVHFERRYHGAQHYMGFSTNVPERVKAHRAGRGAPLLAAVSKRGIPHIKLGSIFALKSQQWSSG